MYPDSLSEESNQYFFKIPKSKPITIVAYKQEGSKHLFDIQRTNSSADRISMDQKELSFDKIKEQISLLK